MEIIHRPGGRKVRRECEICHKKVLGVLILALDEEALLVCHPCSRTEYPKMVCAGCGNRARRYYQFWCYCGYDKGAPAMLTLYHFCTEVCFRVYYDLLSKELKFSAACSVCQKTAKHACGRCQIAQYCSKDCQVADWASHKKLCFETKPSQSSGEVTRKGCYYCDAKIGDNLTCQSCETRPEFHSCRECGAERSRQSVRVWMKERSILYHFCSPECIVRYRKWMKRHCGWQEFCANCGKTAECKKCSVCQARYYCSRECQKADWPNHKAFCHSESVRAADPKEEASGGVEPESSRGNPEEAPDP